MMKQIRLTLVISVCLGTGLLVAGCPNQGGAAAGASGNAAVTTATTGTFVTGASGSTGTTLTKSATASFKMVTVQAAANASGASGGPLPTDPAPTFTLIFDATSTAHTLTDVCQASGNAAGGSGAPAANTSTAAVITRVVTEAPTQVTGFQVQCPGPDVYNDPTELPDSTIIKVQLIPDTTAGNNSGFQSTIVDYTKQPLSTTGDFQDALGNSFLNIFHYSCYDIQSKNLTIAHSNAVFTTDPITNTPINAIESNIFDIGGGTAPTAFSAQSYYFDFYVRSNEKGSINTGNAGFTCPQVNVNGNPTFYPLDSSFSLALQQSQTYSVGIQGRTTIAVGKTAPGNFIGFAALPNADGSCPSFPDNNGQLQRTFRLRQYSALYPLRYQASGDLQDSSQQLNTIYLLDRPVDRLGQDPLKPITRIGPKPCPFSFDTAQFGQKCITDASLAGWNIDGTQIDGSPKCPIYPPVNPKLLKVDEMRAEGGFDHNAQGLRVSLKHCNRSPNRAFA